MTRHNGQAQKLNKKLVKELYKSERFTDPRVGEAFLAVRRHLFLPGFSLETAYSDHAIATKYDERQRPISSSSQPAMMAIMLEQLQLEKGMNVLEIGAGTGFNAGLMGHFVAPTGHITTIDIDADIIAGARTNLRAAEVNNVTAVHGDGMAGYPSNAPYDRIVLTVGAADIAPAWWDQLKEDGILLLPLSLNGPQKSIAFKKCGNELQTLSIHDCGFMQLRGEMTAPNEKVIHLNAENGGLDLLVRHAPPVTAARIFEWLNGPVVELPTNLLTTRPEAWGSLALWLALYEPDLCRLLAEGEWTAWEPLPVLFDYSNNERPYTLTDGLLGATGIALLTRGSRPDHDLFFLAIHAFGAGAILAEQLYQQLRNWDAAARPGSQRLRLRAFPSPAPITPGAGETLLERTYTSFLISWAPPDDLSAEAPPARP